MPRPVPIRDQSIDLDQFLKLAGLVQSGGHASFLIKDGQVTVNGTTELRRRRTLRIGDVVETEDQEPCIVASRTPPPEDSE